MSVESTSIVLPSPEAAIALCGEREENLRLLQRQTGAELVLRGQELHLRGTMAQLTLCRALITALEPLWSPGQNLSAVDILTARHALDTHQPQELQALR